MFVLVLTLAAVCVKNIKEGRLEHFLMVKQWISDACLKVYNPSSDRKVQVKVEKKFLCQQILLNSIKSRQESLQTEA